jgi:hypothetical protein
MHIPSGKIKLNMRHTAIIQDVLLCTGYYISSTRHVRAHYLLNYLRLMF